MDIQTKLFNSVSWWDRLIRALYRAWKHRIPGPWDYAVSCANYVECIHKWKTTSKGRQTCIKCKAVRLKPKGKNK